MITFKTMTCPQIHRLDSALSSLGGRLTRIISPSVTAGAIAVGMIVGSAQSAAAQAVTNIVLVHGAFSDGSSWAKVIMVLQAKGYQATAVQIPLTSLADDVAVTKRVLAAQTGPVILVGHSWGGVVITETGMDANVVGLVYVNALAPDIGETVGDLGSSYPTPPSLASPVIDQQGFMTLSSATFVEHFASDLPAAEARALAATQGPIKAAAFGSKVSSVAWKAKPSWFIIGKQDQAIDPDEERFFAKRMNATTTELSTSHLPMLSKPKAVATVIMDAAAKVSRSVASNSGGTR